MLSGGKGNARWIDAKELKVCLATDGVASYVLPGTGRRQFALFAACLFPARLSRKTNSVQKMGKFGGVTRTDVRAMPEDFFTVGDLSSGLETVF